MPSTKMCLFFHLNIFARCVIYDHVCIRVAGARLEGSEIPRRTSSQPRSYFTRQWPIKVTSLKIECVYSLQHGGFKLSLQSQIFQFRIKNHTCIILDHQMMAKFQLSFYSNNNMLEIYHNVYTILWEGYWNRYRRTCGHYWHCQHWLAPAALSGSTTISFRYNPSSY